MAGAGGMSIHGCIHYESTGVAPLLGILLGIFQGFQAISYYYCLESYTFAWNLLVIQGDSKQGIHPDGPYCTHVELYANS